MWLFYEQPKYKRWIKPGADPTENLYYVNFLLFSLEKLR